MKKVFSFNRFVPLLLAPFALAQGAEPSASSQSSFSPGAPLQDNVSFACPVDASYVTECGWDPHVSANYLYWNWDSSNMTIGELTEVGSVVSREWEKITPGYSSGFKVGAGFALKTLDQWSFFSKYTWYNNSADQSLTGTEETPLLIVQGASPLSEKPAVGTFNTNVFLGYQGLDVSLTKSFYVGKNVIVQLGSGLNTLWITNSKHETSQQLIVSGINVFENFDRNLTQTSWSLGPKLHLSTDWLLGYGLKVLFNLSPSVLYSSFNLEGLRTDMLNGTFESSRFTRLHNYGTITPVLESFLGMGWGDYFANHKFHLDLVLGFDFNAYWNFDYLGGYVYYPQDMYLYGLNAQVRFDF